MLSVIALSALTLVKTANAQDVKEQWPGVMIKNLTENEHVKVFQVTFAPGAVADWHSHPQHTIYAVTDTKTQTEEKGKETTITELKAGEARWLPAVTHKTTNVGKTPYTVIVTEIK